MSLAAALAKAQQNFGAVHKSRRNDHFKSDYATLADVISAVRPALNAEGIALVQPIENGDIVSRLILGDEQIESRLPLPLDGVSAQQLGSTITYFRRFTLAALVGVAAEDDDDGNTAAEVTARPSAPRDRSRTIPVTAASQKQMDLIDRLVRDLKIESLRDALTQLVLDELPPALSTAQASKLIDALQDAKKGQWPNGWINAPAGNRIDDGEEPF